MLQYLVVEDVIRPSMLSTFNSDWERISMLRKLLRIFHVSYLIFQSVTLALSAPMGNDLGGSLRKSNLRVGLVFSNAHARMWYTSPEASRIEVFPAPFLPTITVTSGSKADLQFVVCRESPRCEG